MYYYILLALDQGTETQLLDLINSPLDTDKYQALKDQLLETFGLCKWEHAPAHFTFNLWATARPPPNGRNAVNFG